MNEIEFGNNSLNLISSHIEMIRIHSNALAAHCECLAMNAENMMAAMANENAVFGSSQYFEVMRKWGLIDNTGKPEV